DDEQILDVLQRYLAKTMRIEFVLEESGVVRFRTVIGGRERTALGAWHEKADGVWLTPLVAEGKPDPSPSQALELKDGELALRKPPNGPVLWLRRGAGPE